MKSVGLTDGVSVIRIHRESLEGVNSLEEIPSIKSIYAQHTNGFYEYKVKKILIDPVDSDAYYITIKAEHGTIPTGSANTPVIFTPYIAGKFKNSDYDALLGNAVQGAGETQYMVVDNSTSQLTPSNLNAINNRSAGKAQLVESNYEVESYSGPRYKGTKHTSTDFNIASTQTGVPPVSDPQTYFAYFNWIGGTTPDIQRKTGASIKYYIDLDGNVINPTDDEITVSIVEQNFRANEDVTISLNDVEFAGNDMSSLEGDAKVLAAGKRIENIISTLDGSYSNAVTASHLYFTSASSGEETRTAHHGWEQGSNLNSVTQSFNRVNIVNGDCIFLGIEGEYIDETDLINNGTNNSYKPVSPSPKEIPPI